jgi:hypothetical protein
LCQNGEVAVADSEGGLGPPPLLPKIYHKMLEKIKI